MKPEISKKILGRMLSREATELVIKEISLEFRQWYNSMDSKDVQKEFPGDYDKIYDHWISNIYKPKEND